ncbi:retrotransposon protein, putative, ty1-copia subclass [Tanacetum coccineum]
MQAGRRTVLSLILVSLRKEYDSFMQNYNMHDMGKTVTELHAMLKLHEQTLPKKDDAPALHVNRAGKGLRGSRKLKPRALSMYVGDGDHAAVEAIGSYHLCIPSGLVLVLHNCHYAPSITRGIISVSCLNGNFEINLSNSNTNDSSMYPVSNKRAKINLDLTLLKMARKPYTHQVERVKDLLGLIHIDVCGPFRTMSKQGAIYFVTFTDDFSRYGYVYLLKHKHEVFETFKVFQKEVENQLWKSIKSLHSDRRGEYISQEFLDYLKEHGIIAHRIPPYTPQHNGVSERRNRTLLDMVRSMMSQTTLLKFFWDYALESAARILNMVQNKKVEKILYEIWHGQAPKLSYLKVWSCKALVKTHPSVNTSLHHDEDDQEINEPQSDINPIRRSTKTRHALDRMCLLINAEEHELGDHNEPANYKFTLLDPEFDKWLDAMNVEMQFMKDNEV